MLDNALKDQVTSVFANLKNNYRFVVAVADNHPNRDELLDLLNEVASCSSKISCSVTAGNSLEFSLQKNEVSLPVIFKAVPTGHEFTSLLLLILNADGIGKNIPDEDFIRRIKSLKGSISIQSYISLTCTNCPDVVQALNLLCIYNSNITHQIIDGSINQAEVERLNIQAVPTVYANGNLLHVGRSSLAELLAKLEAMVGTTAVQNSQSNKQYDVIVAGGGPAGVSAAIYSARKGIKVAIVAEQIGGQVLETVGIENLISVPYTTGKTLATNLSEHLGSYPIDILSNRRIEQVTLVDGQKNITTSLGETLQAPALIIATGATWRRLNIPGESQYIGSGVAFCAHCDGPFYKNKTVVVVGGGNSGLEAAIDLSAIASNVTILEYQDSLKGDKVLQDKIKTISNIRLVTGAETVSIEGDGTKVTGLTYRNRLDGNEQLLPTDGIFVQIGLKANSSVFASVVEVNKVGEIVIDAHCRTSTKGIYAAGDVSVVPYKQIVIAMGEGAKASLSAFEDKIKNVI